LEDPVVSAALTQAPPPSTGARAGDDTRLLVRYHRHHDMAARDELVERFLPLARQLARRYQRGTEPLDDLVQVASIGLVKAIDRFDPSRGTAFSSYAVPTILGELKRYFRDTGWALHVPRGMQERVIQLNAAVSRLSRQFGRSPSLSELADCMGVTAEDVLEAMQAATAYDAMSLDGPRSTEDEEGDTHIQALGGLDENFALVDLRVSLGPTLDTLSARDRLVLHLRLVEDMTQTEIAERIGVSQMHVSRLIRRALERLQSAAA
jgi:RNA polymerase sigma-B factor